MKKIFYILAILFITTNSVAQVNTNLIVSATPPSKLLQWSTNREILTFLVQPLQGAQGQYKIKTEIKLADGTVVGRNDLNTSRTYTLSSTTTIYTAADVVPMENMIFLGSVKKSIDKSGKLPADNYQICTQLVRLPDFTPFSEIKCKNFIITQAQMPILMKPYNEEALDYDIAKTTITFRWTPIIPKPQGVVTYKIYVFEVLPHQNPIQAMRSNFPILTQEVRGTTQYIWQPRGIIDNDNYKMANDSTKRKKDGYVGHVTLIKQRTIKPTNSDSALNNVDVNTYVWTIQSLDNLGQPLGDGNVNGDGVSEPIIFKVAKGGKEVDKLKEEIKK